MEESTVLFEGDVVERMISRMAHEIAEHLHDSESLLLLGIERGGVALARRLKQLVSRYADSDVLCASLDVTAFRDDQRRAALDDDCRTSRAAIPSVEGRHVILVDDVLYTGRTVRSAIDAVMLTGRPAKIELCVLVDRGHRELPIKADYVGKNIPTARGEEIEVSLPEDTGKNVIRLVRK